MKISIGNRRMTSAYFTGGCASWSSTRFTSASARAFCLRGTCRMSTSSKSRSSLRARAYSGCRPACLTRYSPPQLLDDQLRIQPNAEPPDAALGGRFEPEHERGPLGNVIRRNAKVSADLLDELAAGIEQHRRARGGPGIPARAAVGKKRRLHFQRGSPVRRHRPPGSWVTPPA